MKFKIENQHFIEIQLIHTKSKIVIQNDNVDLLVEKRRQKGIEPRNGDL